MTWFVIGFFLLWVFRKKLPKRRVQIGAGLLLLFLYVITTPFVPRTLVQQYESRFAPLNPLLLDTTQHYHIMVLGGGVGYDNRLPATALLEEPTLARLVEAVRLYHKIPHATCITSGGSTTGKIPLAEIAKNAAQELGIPANRLHTLPAAINTEQEALHYAEKFGLHTPLIIATSALHMPRAVMLFKKAGVKQVLAAPCHFMVKQDFEYQVSHLFKPRLRYIGWMHALLHEKVGILYAKLKTD